MTRIISTHGLLPSPIECVHVQYANIEYSNHIFRVSVRSDYAILVWTLKCWRRDKEWNDGQMRWHSYTTLSVVDSLDNDNTPIANVQANTLLESPGMPILVAEHTPLAVDFVARLWKHLNLTACLLDLKEFSLQVLIFTKCGLQIRNYFLWNANFSAIVFIDGSEGYSSYAQLLCDDTFMYIPQIRIASIHDKTAAIIVLMLKI